MPDASTVVQTISAALAAAGVVAGAAKYTGIWGTFVARISRAIQTGSPQDIEAGAQVASTAGRPAVVALDNMQRRFSGEQARRVGEIRRRVSI
jgi:hypothetical protein